MSRVIVVDKGWAKIKANLQGETGGTVKVGIQGEAGIVDIAIYNEFGTKTIPSRPFMRTATDDNRANINRIMEMYAKQIISGQIGVRAALGRVGEWFTNRIQLHISNSKTWAEENADSTIAAKGSSTPLIDTGRLRQSVRWVIDK